MDIEGKYLEKIWNRINNGDDNRLMLSWDEQFAIMEILKQYHKEQLPIGGVVGSLPASKEEALSKRKILADKYYRNDPCESAFAIGFINCYEWLERIIKT